MPESAWRALVERPEGDVALEVVVESMRPAARASNFDKQLLQSLRNGDVQCLVELAAGDDRTVAAAQLMLGLGLLGPDPERGVRVLAAVLHSGSEPAESGFVRRYLPGMQVWAKLAPSVRAVMPVSRGAIVLLLADAYTDMGRPVDAVRLLEGEPVTPLTVLALGAGYLARGRFEAVVELTDGTTNADDCTALSLVTRAVALRSLNQLDEALASANAALARAQQPAGVIAIALEERSQIFELQGNEPAAQADADRLIVLEGFSTGSGTDTTMKPAATAEAMLEAARAKARPTLRGTGAAGSFAGRHHTTYREEVRSMVKAGMLEQAEDLLLGLLDVAEEEANEKGTITDPAYYRALANLFSHGDRRFDEYAVLERHARAVLPDHQPDSELDGRRLAVAAALGIIDELSADDVSSLDGADGDPDSEFSAPPGYRGPFVSPS